MPQKKTAVAAAAGALAIGIVWSGIAAAQDDPQPRAEEITFRSYRLRFRSGAPDGSQKLEETAEERTLTLSADVFFEFDEATLVPEAENRLGELADELTDLGPRQIAIGGHTDSEGADDYNQDLSERRAEAVRVFLERELGDGYTFEVNGHGETEPVAPNQNDDGSDNPDGRAQNRRVEITYPTT